MTAIGQSLGDDVCKALPGMHALTGCDSTSALVRKANVKRQAFRMVESDSNICAVLMLTVRKQRRIHGQSSIQTVLQQEYANMLSSTIRLMHDFSRERQARERQPL